MGTLDWWLTLVQGVVMTAVAVLLYSVRQAFTGGQTYARIMQRIADVEDRAKAIEGRVDRAGGKMSDLAGDVQGLPDRLRTEFYTRTVIDLIKDESMSDRRAVWDELSRLRAQLERRNTRR